MDLWIRSQDRTGIFKVDVIFVNEKQIIKRVYGDDEVTGIVLGTYETEERALEVLDEIENLLKGKLIIKVNRALSRDDFKVLSKKFGTDYIVDNNIEITGHENANIIYEMPKE